MSCGYDINKFVYFVHRIDDSIHPDAHGKSASQISFERFTNTGILSVPQNHPNCNFVPFSDVFSSFWPLRLVLLCTSIFSLS